MSAFAQFTRCYRPPGEDLQFEEIVVNIDYVQSCHAIDAAHTSLHMSGDYRGASTLNVLGTLDDVRVQLNAAAQARIVFLHEDE